MTTDLEQKVINETFDGDKDAYERAWSRTSKDTIKWSQVVDATSTEDEAKHQALNLIAFHFGYTPDEHLTFPYVPVLLALIEDWKKKYVDYETFVLQSEQCLIGLRNQLVYLHAVSQYPSSTYEEYSLLPSEYKLKTKERLNRLLGYLPSEDASIQCELALSSVLSSDIDNLGFDLTDIDCRIFLIIKYREVLLSDGKFVADLSPLPIQKIKAYNKCYSEFTLT